MKKFQALSFLAKFGYLEKKNSTDSAGGRDVNSPEVRKAIEDLQRFGSLPVTGKLDAETLELVSQKRCGLEDPVKKLNSGNEIGQFYLQGTYWKKKVCMQFFADQYGRQKVVYRLSQSLF